MLDTGGDSFFVVFERASDAVSAAVEAQDGLNEVGVRVRMGIHSGEPSVSNDEYVGMDVHRAARVMAAARRPGAPDAADGRHARRRVRASRPRRAPAQGPHGSAPAVPAGHRAVPAATESGPGAAADRPGPAGRAQARAGRPCAPAATGLASSTITGPGGVGKTRLATAAAQELVESYNDGVTFVDLAPIRDPEVVLPTIADALAIEGDLASQIGTGQHLLVLDNVEQVVDAAPDIAGLLVAAPGVAVLATSREPLRIAGEHEFRLRPLSEAPAVELFRQRAQAARYDFEADYRQLARICERLDNLPLAIELAAARMSSPSPDVLLERLDRRLSVLAAANRGVPARQQTLRATIQWSYGLTTEEGSSTGWRSFAAGGPSTPPRPCATPTSTPLPRWSTRISFARTGSGSGCSRRFANTPANVSSSASNSLTCVDATRSSTPLAGQAASLRGPGREWLDRVEAEHDNFRAALDCSLEADVELGFRITESLLFWHLRAHEAEARRWVERALETSDSLSPTARATGLHVLGALLFWEETSNVLPVLSRRAWGSPVRPATNAGSRRSPTPSATRPGPWATESGLASCARRRSGSAGSSGIRVASRGRCTTSGRSPGHRRSGRSPSSVRGEPRRDARAGDKSFVMASLHGLGDLELDSGNLSAASQRYRESLALALELDTPHVVLLTLAGLASVAAASRDLARAGHLWAAVEAMEERRGIRILPFERERYERTLDPYVSAPAFVAGLAEGKSSPKATSSRRRSHRADPALEASGPNAGPGEIVRLG